MGATLLRVTVGVAVMLESFYKPELNAAHNYRRKATLLTVP